MEENLTSPGSILRQEVRIGVARAEQRLKNEHAGRPNSWTPSKPWKDIFTHDGLDLEQKKSAEEDGESIDRDDRQSLQRRLISSGVVHVRKEKLWVG